MTWLRTHHNWICNVLSVVGVAVAGVVSGGVFTLPVLITAATGVVAKIAQSPVTKAP